MDPDEMQFCEKAALAVCSGMAQAYFAKVSKGGIPNVDVAVDNVAEMSWQVAEKMVEHRRRIHGRRRAIVRAPFIKEHAVKDPDTKEDKVIAFFKDPTSGGIVGIDTSFLEEDDEIIIHSPFQPEVSLILEEYEP